MIKKIILLLKKHLINILLLTNIVLLSNCHKSTIHKNFFVLKEKLKKNKNISKVNINYFLYKTISKMLKNVDHILYKNRILINEIQNHTNYAFNTQHITQFIEQILHNRYKNNFNKNNILNINTLKRKFKLMIQDNLLSKNKILFIAKYIKIKYVLFNDISGDVHSILLHTELIAVDSEEIIWNTVQFIQKK